MYSSMTNRIQSYTMLFIIVNAFIVINTIVKLCILLVMLKYINDTRSHESKIYFISFLMSTHLY